MRKDLVDRADALERIEQRAQLRLGLAAHRARITGRAAREQCLRSIGDLMERVSLLRAVVSFKLGTPPLCGAPRRGFASR